jgi:hypothetical protein
MERRTYQPRARTVEQRATRGFAALGRPRRRPDQIRHATHDLVTAPCPCFATVLRDLSAHRKTFIEEVTQ